MGSIGEALSAQWDQGQGRQLPEEITESLIRVGADYLKPSLPDQVIAEMAAELSTPTFSYEPTPDLHPYPVYEVPSKGKEDIRPEHGLGFYTLSAPYQADSDMRLHKTMDKHMFMGHPQLEIPRDEELVLLLQRSERPGIRMWSDEYYGAMAGYKLALWEKMGKSGWKEIRVFLSEVINNFEQLEDRYMSVWVVQKDNMWYALPAREKPYQMDFPKKLQDNQEPLPAGSILLNTSQKKYDVQQFTKLSKYSNPGNKWIQDKALFCDYWYVDERIPDRNIARQWVIRTQTYPWEKYPESIPQYVWHRFHAQFDVEKRIIRFPRDKNIGPLFGTGKGHIEKLLEWCHLHLEDIRIVPYDPPKDAPAS